MKIPCIVLLMVLANPLAVAQEATEPETYFPQQMTAKDLLFACAASSLTSTGRARQRYCYGFISGVEEGIRLHGLQYSTEIRNTLCVPQGASSRELTNAYVKYASGKSVDLGMPAASVVIEALKKAFPCDVRRGMVEEKSHEEK